ncbi:FtsK/SpoIIIE domain-containing protein [Mycobacterium hackensackense]|uniref:FtsK/SpoIIIE domain-containing protein n=1 Tax=Mycobacterium hackensackense TaxID=228909 RepID=UPI002265B0BA|nr:FtsK/SpoIIIE domain-containing protein [Mycobacterium hackensackense]
MSYTAALRAVGREAPEVVVVQRDDCREVDEAFLDALGVGAVDTFDPADGWGRNARDAALRVPVGMLADGSEEVVSVEFSAASAVWFVAGVAGTGKSVALEALALAMCALYPPGRVRLAFLDLKGATFEQCAELPHVVCSLQRQLGDPPFLNATDFCSAVGAEVDRRAALRLEKLRAEADFVVLIDAFDELVLFNPEVIALYARLVTEGPALGVRVVVASMRHEVYRDELIPLRHDAAVVFRSFPAASAALLGGVEATTLPLRAQAYLRDAVSGLTGPVRMFYAAPVASILSQRIRGR